jgi:hypothetical protein
MENNQNAWTFCNYNDPDVGYPRDCGRNGWVSNNWFSMPGGRFNARGINGKTGFRVYKGSDCPSDFGVELSAAEKAKQAK